MPQINTPSAEDTRSFFTNYTGSINETNQTFTFLDTQNGMTFRNKGNSIVILTVDGEVYRVPPQATIEIDDNSFLSFDARTQNGSQQFEITAFREKSNVSGLGSLQSQVSNLTTQLAQTASQANLDTTNNNLTNGLASKVDKNGNEQVTLAMLSQDVKESMTGGSVAVVGTNAVNTTNLVDKSATWSKRTALGQQAYVSYGYGQVFNIDTANSQLVIPANTVFRNGHYMYKTGSVVNVSLLAGYQYIFVDEATNTFVSVPYNSGNAAYLQTYLLVCTVTFDAVISRINLQGVNDYTIDGKRKQLSQFDNDLKLSNFVNDLNSNALVFSRENGGYPVVDMEDGTITFNSYDSIYVNGVRHILKSDVPQSLVGYGFNSSFGKILLNKTDKSITVIKYSLSVDVGYELIGTVKYTSTDGTTIKTVDLFFPFMIDGKLYGLAGSGGDGNEKKTMYNPLFIPKRVRFIGHRGLSGLQPENTIPAFEECGKRGMFGAETDIRKTLDGEFVCMHDATVDRTTDGIGNVADLTLAQIKAFTIDYGANIQSHTGLKVPTLAEMLIACSKYGLSPMLHLYIDTADVAALVQQVNDLGFEKTVIYTSTSPTQLQIVNQYSDSIVMGLGGATSDLSIVGGDGLVNYGRYVDYTAYNNYPDAIKSGHENQQIMMTWAINDIEVAKDFINRGIDGITTDTLYSLE